MSNKNWNFDELEGTIVEEWNDIGEYECSDCGAVFEIEKKGKYEHIKYCPYCASSNLEFKEG